MRQVLFHIPSPWPQGGIPVYGFGLMLFLAFVLTTWVAGRRAEKAGISKDRLQDLAIWTFVFGLLGARIVYMIQYHRPIEEFFKIWEGGIVFYGSLVGGTIGFTLAYYFIFRKLHIPWLRLADVIAPSLALGLALGRIGCFLNGCCFGNVACPDCPQAHFPLSAPPRFVLVGKGYETAAGFVMPEPLDVDARVVAAVEPESAAAKAGLHANDLVEAVELLGERAELTSSGRVRPLGKDDHIYPDLRDYVYRVWSRDKRGGDIPLGVTVNKKPLSFDVQPNEDPALVDFGFTMRDCAIGAVEPASPAADKGLRPHDVIVKADNLPINFYGDLQSYLGHSDSWPRGKNDLSLTVVHPGETAPVALDPFVPRTIGLHPTQLYETISMMLLFLLMIAYHPFRRHDGEIVALFLLLYPIHRFLNEMLRNDTDPVAFGLTLSQNGSVLVFVVALALAVWLWRRPVQYPKSQPA